MTDFSIRDSVGEALRFSRENWRVIASVGAAGAVTTAALTWIGLLVPVFGIFTGIASGFVQAFVYAALIGAVLFGASAVRGRVGGDGMRVWAAMVVVGFFLLIVFFVLSIPVFMALFAGPLGAYTQQLEQAGSNQEAVRGVMITFAEENPLAVLIVMLFYAAIWFLLTSRLYLAAPASVEQNRILTFETWAWTKGSALRITGARLLLLLPANVLAGALGYLIGRGFGVDTLNLAADAAAIQANPTGFVAYVLISSFITFAVYSALEAGLSSNIYRSLRQDVSPPSA
jgi:hypothetical protein